VACSQSSGAYSVNVSRRVPSGRAEHTDLRSARGSEKNASTMHPAGWSSSPFAASIHREWTRPRSGSRGPFFSCPRGGARSWCLLGRWATGRLTITEYAPLDCEHATGPSFVSRLAMKPG